MLTFVARRALAAVPVLLVASFLSFWFVRVTVDPTAKLRQSRDPQAVARLRERLRLDEPVVVQYGAWVRDALRGDLGTSERTGEPVSRMLRRALWTTTQLLIWGTVAAAVVAVGVGVYSALRAGGIGDHLLTTLAFVGLAMPPFWFGLLAIQVLAIDLTRWLGLSEPLFGFVGLHSADGSGFTLDYLRHLVLPVMTLTVGIVAEWSRFQRASMLEALGAPYIRTARAKGVPRSRLVVRHALRNALLPLVTVMALDVGLLFGGVIVTEQIFSIPGMGRLFVESLRVGDAPVLVAWTVVTATFVIVANLVADLAYGALDPRVRLR